MRDLRTHVDDLDALDHAISSLVGEPTSHRHASRLDPSLAATLDVIAAGWAPGIDPAFVDRLGDTLTRATLGSSGRLAAARRLRGGLRNGSSRVRTNLPYPLPQPGRGLATTAVSVLLLTLVLAGSAWTTLVVSDGDRPVGSTEAVVTIEEPVGVGCVSVATIDRFTLQSGGTMSALRLGASLVLVERGDLTLTWSGTDERRRLRAGHSATVPHSATLQARNDGRDAVTFLLVGVDPEGTVNPLPPASAGMTVEHFMVEGFDEDMPNGARVTLRSERIQPSTSRSLATSDGIAWVIGDDLLFAVTFTGDRVPDGFQAGVERIAPAERRIPVGPDVAMIVRNDVETPITVLVLAIEPIEPASPAG